MLYPLQFAMQKNYWLGVPSSPQIFPFCRGLGDWDPCLVQFHLAEDIYGNYGQYHALTTEVYFSAVMACGGTWEQSAPKFWTVGKISETLFLVRKFLSKNAIRSW